MPSDGARLQRVSSSSNVEATFQPHRAQIALYGSLGIDKYPAKAHALRVAGKLGYADGLIVIKGQVARPWPNSDMASPFRQDRYFYYLTGCNEPDCGVTYDIARDNLTLWLPEISERKSVWGGQGSTIEAALEKYDIDEARYLTGSSKQVLHGCLKGNYGASESGKVRLFGRDVRPVPTFSLKDAIDSCRVVKDEHEIGLIRKANEISTLAHIEVLKRLSRLHSEPEVEAVYMGVCIAHRAKTQAYDPICGSGQNAATLHYMVNNEQFGNRQTLLIDAGCEWDCYASDITRTMPINPKQPGHWQSKEAEAIYALVEKVQEHCIRMLRPGKAFLEVHFAALSITLSGLLELGILKGTFDDLWKAGIVRVFFPHGLGHHVGLEVHDVSGEPRATSAENFDRMRGADFESVVTEMLQESQSHEKVPEIKAPVLESGNVVTIEPGVYFNKFALRLALKHEALGRFINKEVLKKYLSVGGVRIEDDILITRDGYENLTKTPKGKEALKIIRDAAKSGRF